MTSSPRQLVSQRALLMLLMLCATCAHAITGTSRMELMETMSTNGCGSYLDFSSAVLTLRAGHKWRASTASGLYAGTFTEDSSRRNFNLRFDAASTARLRRYLARAGANLCRLPVKVESLSVPVLKLHLNGARNRLSGSMTVTAVGSTSRGRGSARFRIVVDGSFVGR